MKKMKWTMLLAVLLAALLPCAAFAAAGDANIARYEDLRDKYEDGVYNGACVCGDTLYMLGGEHVFTYHIGDADITALEYQMPDVGENEGINIVKLFSDGERLYALYTLSYYGEDAYGIRDVGIYPLEVGEDGLTFGEPQAVDYEDLMASYGSEYSYFIQVNSACYVDGYLMLYVYRDNGEEAVYAMDIESGEGRFIEDLERPRLISAYKDDRLLIETYDYGTDTCSLLLYDPESDSITEACPPIEANEMFRGLVYSQESGRLFYMHSGYVMAVEDFDFENAQEVAELSALYYSDTCGMLLPGDYYVYSDFEGTAIRATDPDALPDTRLVIRGAGYSDAAMAAYYSFGNTHGDVAVVLDSGYYPRSEIIESMMSRDSSIDIYMMSVNSEAYDALYSRGYLVEMDNEAIVSEVKEMYPAIQDAVTRDGEIVAIPVDVYSWTMGLDYEGFEKIGIAREDVPDNWPDFLDLLPELPELLPEEGNVRIFPEYMTQQQARMELFNTIMDAWRIHQMAMGREASYNEPELIELFDKVMALDYEALGLPEEDDDDEAVAYRMYSSGQDRDYILIETSTGCTIGNFYSDNEPALLSVIPGEPGDLPLRLSVAFINPFSEHVDIAQEFLAVLMENMSNRTLYNLSDKLNEPIRDRYSEQSLAEWQKNLEEQQAALEEADPVDKPAIEEYIADIEQTLIDIDRYGWDIPARDIEWYRAHEDALIVERFDFLSAADDDGELSDLAEQFMAGKVSPADFLKEVDRKVRMRALEGN